MPGSVFFALKGENYNGNEFASEAINKGAAFSVVDEPHHKKGERILLVDNVLRSMQELAHHHRLRLNPVVIAITGTNGKTTTKELVYRVLSTQYKTLATLGNLNNHIGVPLTLLRLEEHHTHSIIEMGANHRYEIEALCNIACPDYGLITNIGKAHLEGFGGSEGVAKGKTELFYYLFKNNGIAFVNMLESETVLYSQRNQRICFSSEGEFTIASLISDVPNIQFELEGKTYASPLSGKFNFNNILSAIAIGKYFKIDPDMIGKAIATYTPQNMRQQWISWNSNLVLLDAYNANPDSMRAAIENFNAMEFEGKILVLGDMFELGKDTFQEHQNIIEHLKQFRFDEILLCGSSFARLNIIPGARVFEEFSSLLHYFQNRNYRDKKILIKGSRGMKMERLLEE